jgi:DNA-binding transcriptional LysR family regulator
MVTRQRLRVGAGYAGKIITVHVRGQTVPGDDDLTADDSTLALALAPGIRRTRGGISRREAPGASTGRFCDCVRCSASPRMTEIIAAFETRHPGAEAVLVITGLTRNYLDAMRDGDVDLVAARLPVSGPDITIGLFWPARTACCASPGPTP